MEKINYKRNKYLDKIRPFIDKPLIKIITGIRRSGKSYLLQQIIEEINNKQTEKKQIVYINKELIKYDFIHDYKDLYEYINYEFKNTKHKKYLFIDEIQLIEEWEKTISSLFASNEYDIFITGSNSNLLSSEIAGLLSGRYIEFTIFPFSFQEFLGIRDKNNNEKEKEFYTYMKYGGFPVIQHFQDNEELILQYLNSLYNTILLKDIVSRYQIRNIQLFENLTKYVFSNIGSTFSARSISKYLKSQRLNISLDTITNYLQYLENAYIVHKVKRFDLKGKKVLDIYEKYYLSDLGLKTAITGYRDNDIAGVLKNIIYLKLKQQDYQVFIGKLNGYEIDFIAKKNDDKIYIQVAYLLSSKETFEREFFPLKQIKDNYRKFVLTLDKLPRSNNEGIIRMNIIDFLTSFND